MRTLPLLVRDKRMEARNLDVSDVDMVLVMRGPMMELRSPEEVRSIVFLVVADLTRCLVGKTFPALERRMSIVALMLCVRLD